MYEYNNMKLKNILSEAMSGLPIMKVISNPFAKSFAVVNEAEDDKYVHIGYGKYKEKGKENDKSAPTFTKDDSGKYVPSLGGDSKPQSDKGGETKPNMFAKDYDAPDLKKDEPKSEPSKPKREGNPDVNKATLSKAKKLGITPQKLGKEEYQKKMAQAAIEALTDSNYHTEARELVAKLEGKPEMAERPVYPSMKDPQFKEKMAAIRTKYASEYTDNVDGDVRDLGISASQEAGWGGVDAADSIAFTLRMNGFHKLADTIQSVVQESYKGKISLKKL